MTTQSSSSLELTPHGFVICCNAASNELADFAKSDAAGLIAIGGRKLTIKADPSVGFWKSFSSSFLRALCHIPEGADVAAPPPSTAELAEMVLNAPPMRGAEYLSPDVLSSLW